MKRKMTAAQLMERLNADSNYIARKKEQSEKLRLKAEEYARAEAPLVQALNEAGVPVSSVWDLVNADTKKPPRTFKISTDPSESVWNWLDAEGKSYSAVVHLLLNHLQRPYPDRVRAGIARALAVPEAKSAWPLLLELYRQEQGDWSRDGLAVALSSIADDDHVDELIALAKDPKNGKSRVLLLNALRRSRLPKAQKALMQFGTDSVLHKEAVQILRRRRAKRVNK